VNRICRDFFILNTAFIFVDLYIIVYKLRLSGLISEKLFATPLNMQLMNVSKIK